MNEPWRNTAAVVLAGGYGTRIQSLLPGMPKPMAPVHGRPFIEWIVRFLSKQGIEDVVLSTGHLAERIHRHFEAQPVSGVNVRCFAETSPLGTAGGFLNAVQLSRKRPQAWLILNGDSLLLASLEPLVQSLTDLALSGAVLGVQMADASRYGTLVQGTAGRLVQFDEKKAGPGIINAGVYLFRAEALSAFPKRSPLSFEKDVFPELLLRGFHFRVCCADGPFLDIGTPESLPQAEGFIRSGAEYFE